MAQYFDIHDFSMCAPLPESGEEWWSKQSSVSFEILMQFGLEQYHLGAVDLDDIEDLCELYGSGVPYKIDELFYDQLYRENIA